MKKYIYILFITFLCISCSTKTKVEYIDRNVVEYKTKEIHDTTIVNVHDSIFHTIYQKGDTIFDTKYVEKVMHNDKIVVRKDTCWRDSIQVEIKKEAVVKEIIPKWCYFSLLICVLVFIFASKRIFRWLRTVINHTI